MKILGVALFLALASPFAFGERYGSVKWENELLECPKCWGLQEKDRKQAVRLANKWLVRMCLDDAAHKGISEQTFVLEKRKDTTVCREGGALRKTKHQASAVRYWLQKKDDRIWIHLNLRFNVLPKSTSHARADHMLSYTEACLDQFAAIWDRYNIGVKVNIDAHHIKKLAEKTTLDINLIDAEGRSNSENFYFRGMSPQKERKRQQDFCKMIVHEVGHLVGLDDEYKDSNCPARPYVATDTKPPFSIMARTSGDWSDLEFFPRHVATVISPLCDWSN